MVTESVIVKKADKPINYEMVVILSPQAIDEQLETAINNISNFITSRGGVVSEMNRWGKRSLAYPIRHSNSGTYVLLKFTLKPAVCKELETSLRISDQVLRHLLIKLDAKALKAAAKQAPRPVAAPAPVAPAPTPAPAPAGT
jgi:small subunit ribosomal protein S6